MLGGGASAGGGAGGVGIALSPSGAERGLAPANLSSPAVRATFFALSVTCDNSENTSKLIALQQSNSIHLVPLHTPEEIERRLSVH